MYMTVVEFMWDICRLLTQYLDRIASTLQLIAYPQTGKLIPSSHRKVDYLCPCLK